MASTTSQNSISKCIESVSVFKIFELKSIIYMSLTWYHIIIILKLFYLSDVYVFRIYSQTNIAVLTGVLLETGLGSLRHKFENSGIILPD